MKITCLICLLLPLSISAQESSLLDDPAALISSFRSDKMEAKIETLQTLDSLAANQVVDPGTVEYLIYAMLAQEPSTSRVQIAQRYLLNQEDIALKETGLNYIIDAAIERVDTLDIDSAKSQLVNELERLPGTGQDYYAYAGKAARALVMLGDQRGLDVFLTNSKTIRNYSRKDDWSEDSPHEKLDALSRKYKEKFGQSQSNEWDFFWSQFYALAEERRKQGKLLVASNPLISLDSVLDGTFDPQLANDGNVAVAAYRAGVKQGSVAEVGSDPSIEEVSEVIEETTAPEPAIQKEPAEVIVTEPVEEEVEQSSNWWPWFIGILVIVGVLGLVVRRKN